MLTKICFLLLSLFMFIQPVCAQSSSQKDAAYIATLKAVTDVKLNDEENIKQMEQLRKDKQFNKKLQDMINDLNNSKSKNDKNKRVYKILIDAGRRIYNELN